MSTLPGILKVQVAVAVAATAFGSADTRRATRETDQAEGVERAAIPEWRVDPVPEIVVGVDDQLPGNALHRVAGATRLSDGRLVIANGGSSELRYFGADGKLIGSVGGYGEGPSSFKLLVNIVRGRADTVMVLTYDPAVARVSNEMTIVSKDRIQVGPLRPVCRVSEGNNKRVLSDGSLMLQAEELVGQPGCGSSSDGVYQPTELVTRYDVRSGAVDTLGIFPGPEREGRRYRVFGHVLATAASAGRMFVAPTGGDSIFVFGQNGQRIGSWQVPFAARSIPRRLRNLPPPFSRPIVLPDGTTERPASPSVRNVFPRIGRLVADAVGDLWVMAYPDPGGALASIDLLAPTDNTPTSASEWIVLGPTGHPVAEVTTPENSFVLEVGANYIITLRRDDLDVESVAVHRLTRSAR
jgi:hypothetical protein